MAAIQPGAGGQPQTETGHERYPVPCVAESNRVAGLPDQCAPALVAFFAAGLAASLVPSSSSANAPAP